ncbi:baseplate J/gp47 family protein [Peptoniphilus gorbachii]|uniref:Phage protein gp47/JayE n=1 Tax=Peptoniphilus gorbachii TaxID=411567 RepID=A0ABS2MKF3_9FIRM|nr:baseplate J/gp47 family protein [Peptoniphilus gorbachii]MBM7550506.1 putative phage protein gp47/JayE [Peptoniphilus gorbachii]MDU1582230.1 baseplate J/gp47 family protein [Peptoniphilus harei]MDU1663773.1 baseplate J/gp47 family protein [Peptoniphilus harei]
MARGIYEPIFDDNTFENVLERNLDRIPDEFDKREGSVIYDAIAPMAIEISLLYSYLDFLFKNAFGDTANRYWLIERAKERGIEPYKATKAVIIGRFDAKLNIGDRFFIDDIYYTVSKLQKEEKELFFYELICNEEGSIGNIEGGKLTPTRTISNLNLAEIYKLAILGEDDEDTEDFRERYFETIKSIAYGGNIDDYRKKVKAIDGVGLVKVIPVWNGGGTVKLIITDSEFKEPTSELISKVQEIIDPIPFHQKGVGVAPIGHYVTVVGAKSKKINITCEILKSRDSNLEEIKREIEKDVEEYFKTQRKKWATYEKVDSNIYVENDIRLAKITSIVLNVADVIDYETIKFTDTDKKIFGLSEEELPVLGDVIVTEVRNG